MFWLRILVCLHMEMRALLLLNHHCVIVGCQYDDLQYEKLVRQHMRAHCPHKLLWQHVVVDGAIL